MPIYGNKQIEAWAEFCMRLWKTMEREIVKTGGGRGKSRRHGGLAPPFQFSEQQKQVRFYQTHTQGFLIVVLIGILWPLRLASRTWQCHCISLVMEATHESSLRPLERCRVSSKSPSWVQDHDYEAARRNRREKCRRWFFYYCLRPPWSKIRKGHGTLECIVGASKRCPTWSCHAS